MKKKQFIAGAVLSIALLALAGCSNDKDSVATFEGGTISKEALYNELVVSNGEQALNALVVKEIVNKEADKLKVSVSKDEVADALSKLKEQYGSEEAFKQLLETYNVTEADIKKDLEAELLLENLLKQRVKVSEDEMKTYFKENKEQFSQQEEVKASHILVKTEKEASDLIKQLADGADFTKLAKEHSTDTGSAIDGGDLGFFGKGKMTKPFEEEAFALEVGKVSNPVKTEFGYHIIKVTEKKEAQEATFEKSKALIEETLLNEKLQTEYTSWSDEKFKEYNVEMKLK